MNQKSALKPRFSSPENASDRIADRGIINDDGRVEKLGISEPKKELFTVEEYRKILGDSVSSDEKVRERIQYLQSFCHNVIRGEIEKYVRKTKNKKS